MFFFAKKMNAYTGEPGARPSGFLQLHRPKKVIYEKFAILS